MDQLHFSEVIVIVMINTESGLYLTNHYSVKYLSYCLTEKSSATVHIKLFLISSSMCMYLK